MSDLAAVLARLDKITKGPWDVLGQWIGGSNGEHIATINKYYQGDKRNEANARAIALVPELIAVAKAAAEVAEVYDGRNLRFRNLKHALSALAKRGME